MDSSSKTQKPSKTGDIFISCCRIFLFLVVNSSWTFANSSVQITEVRWRKEYKAIIDGRAVDCAFSGGTQFCKPIFVDIDGDEDLDMFMGSGDGTISFFRNDGAEDQSRWSLVSDLYDSIDVGEKSAPFFADIDDDGDMDLFVGDEGGMVVFYQNDGNSALPLWTEITDSYDSIDVGERSTLFFVDIDADSDLDLFVGEKMGNINFYQNDGTKADPLWSLVTEDYHSIDIGACSTPRFVDIDHDGDFDLFIGEEYGNINFYRNTGTSNSPEWDFVTSNYNSINVGRNSVPVFADIDDDSDFDLFVGQEEGKVCYYRNDGSAKLPDWTFVTENYNFIDLGSYGNPVLADIDGDDDLDLFVGEEDGNINFFRNEMTSPILSWTFVTQDYYAIEAEDHSQPAFADIDSDGDLDLFVGKDDGQIEFYRNIGSSEVPSWMLVSDNYYSIDAGGYSSPAFVDIDADSDLDLFIGQTHGKIFFYRNGGVPQEPSWTLVSEEYNSIDAGKYSVPTFGDLDSDGDFDLLIGNEEGKLFFCRNGGSPQADSFIFVSDNYDSIDVGGRSAPFLCDMDSDGDKDLFIGEGEGGVHFYKNLTLNSIRGRVADNEDDPVPDTCVHLSGDRRDSIFTDSSGNYEFIGLPVGNYCVFLNPGTFEYCFSPLAADTFDIDFLGTTDVSGDVDSFSLLPKTCHLHQNHPNPFNPTTAIPFRVYGSQFMVHGPVRTALKIYNIRGELVRTLVNECKAVGTYEIIWDGRDEDDNQVASGIYFYQLKTDAHCQTKKMIFLK
jgi:hypothetical protein